VKIFWYDGLEKTPDIPGVPKGEILGDLPTRPMNAQAGGQGQGQRPRRRATGFQGNVFDYDEYLAVKNDPNARYPKPDGSLFIGDKGMMTTGTYGAETRLIPAEKMKDYRFPAQLLTRSPGHYRDGSELQRAATLRARTSIMRRRSPSGCC
jgi:hypothetical protein